MARAHAAGSAQKAICVEMDAGVKREAVDKRGVPSTAWRLGEAEPQRGLEGLGVADVERG